VSEATESPKAKSARPWLAPLLALLVFALLATGTYYAFQYFERQNTQALKRALDERGRASQGRATGFLTLLYEGVYKVVDLYRAVGEVDNEALARYTESLFATHPELMVIAWVAADPPSASEALPDASAAVAAAAVASTARIQRVVINKIGPGAAFKLEELQGRELALDPVFEEALRSSGDQERLLYAGLSPDQITMLVPVKREGGISGHVMALINRNLLITIAAKGRPEEGIARRIIDPTGDAGKRLVVYEEFVDQIEAPERMSPRLEQVFAFGKEWTLELIPTPRFFADRTTRLPHYVLIGGLSFALIFAAFVWSLLSRTARVQQLVNRRTAELGDAYQRVRDSEMMAMQAEKMSSLGQMVAGVAHEINTPLGFISSNVQLMREHLARLKPTIENQHKLLSAVGHWPRLNPEQKQMWFRAAMGQAQGVGQLKQDGVIEDMDSLTHESLTGLERLTDLVLTLKNFSRLDRAMVDEVDINNCIEDTLKIAQNVTKQKATVEKKLAKLPRVRCNPSQINQILLNLVSNAAQAIEGFGAIEVTSEADAEFLRVHVKDNGKGIPQDHLDKIFQPFFTTKAQGEGTGLGLAISKRIAEEHGGSLSVESALGRGTTFTLSLPI
jgi:signal transduction histidine kinase